VLRDLRRALIVVVVAAFAFGVLHGWHSAPGPVSRNQDRWHANRPERYSFVFSRGGMAGTCTLAVSVQGSTVVRARAPRPCYGSLDAKHAPTIDDVFSQVRGAYRDGSKVTVTYDSRYGYPTRVDVDPQPNAIDDEWGFGISSFRAS
jgi:hypothetical protein